MCPKDCAKDCAYIVEHLSVRFMAMVADHSRQLAEHRAAFGARTEADAKIIAGLRSEIVAARMAVIERDSLISERDGLLTQVQDMRAEITRLDLKVGEWARRTTPHIDGTPAGSVQQVRAILPAGTESSTVAYEMQSGSIWAVDYCEPCDPPATHDTPEGRSVAEAVIRDSQSRDINDGDLVEVVSNTGRNTWLADVGSVGTVTSIETINDSISVYLDDVPGKKNVLAGYVSLCDVRKVTT